MRDNVHISTHLSSFNPFIVFYFDMQLKKASVHEKLFFFSYLLSPSTHLMFHTSDERLISTIRPFPRHRRCQRSRGAAVCTNPGFLVLVFIGETNFIGLLSDGE
ncbi:hypothetical protein GOODEAATRI_012803 [Goodea atripinnis]|uniref:Uncharacterized protein n=1 Tax=Goodea atripinnis TaxID=208336 RepID=A0ABV0PN36_9TELE